MPIWVALGKGRCLGKLPHRVPIRRLVEKVLPLVVNQNFYTEYTTSTAQKARNDLILCAQHGFACRD